MEGKKRNNQKSNIRIYILEREREREKRSESLSTAEMQLSIKYNEKCTVQQRKTIA